MIEHQAPARGGDPSSRESPAVVPAASPGPEATETENTKAKRLFFRRVQEVPGVVHVERYGGQVIGEQSFIVYVRDGDLDAEYGVYGVEGEVYDRYPEARLSVDLLEESDLPEGSPDAPAANP